MWNFNAKLDLKQLKVMSESLVYKRKKKDKYQKLLSLVPVSFFKKIVDYQDMRLSRFWRTLEKSLMWWFSVLLIKTGLSESNSNQDLVVD